MATLFTKIINQDIPSFKIDENKFCYAFLDINPLRKGHTLIVPKIEEDYIFDLDDKILHELISFSKTIAKKIEKAFDCNRVGVSVIGLEVPHAHIHLIPISGINDMDFNQPKLKLSDAEMQEIADKIINA